jgi:hypothetical protein
MYLEDALYCVPFRSLAVFLFYVQQIHVQFLSPSCKLFDFFINRIEFHHIASCCPTLGRVTKPSPGNCRNYKCYILTGPLPKPPPLHCSRTVMIPELTTHKSHYHPPPQQSSPRSGVWTVNYNTQHPNQKACRRPLIATNQTPCQRGNMM